MKLLVYFKRFAGKKTTFNKLPILNAVVLLLRVICNKTVAKKVDNYFKMHNK